VKHQHGLPPRLLHSIGAQRRPSPSSTNVGLSRHRPSEAEGRPSLPVSRSARASQGRALAFRDAPAPATTAPPPQQRYASPPLFLPRCRAGEAPVALPICHGSARSIPFRNSAHCAAALRWVMTLLRLRAARPPEPRAEHPPREHWPLICFAIFQLYSNPCKFKKLCRIRLNSENYEINFVG
jgi:hypothetical protein